MLQVRSCLGTGVIHPKILSDVVLFRVGDCRIAECLWKRGSKRYIGRGRRIRFSPSSLSLPSDTNGAPIDKEGQYDDPNPQSCILAPPSSVSPMEKTSTTRNSGNPTGNPSTKVQNLPTIQTLSELSGRELAILCHELLSPRSSVSSENHRLLWERTLEAFRLKISSFDDARMDSDAKIPEGFDATDVLIVFFSSVKRVETVRQALALQRNEGSMEDDEGEVSSLVKRSSSPTEDEMRSLLSILPEEYLSIKTVIQFFTRKERHYDLSVMGLGLLLTLLGRVNSRDVQMVESIGLALRQKLSSQKYFHASRRSRISGTKTCLTPALVTICISSLLRLKYLHLPLCDTLSQLLPQSIDNFSPSDFRRIIRTFDKLGYTNNESMTRAAAYLNSRYSDDPEIYPNDGEIYLNDELPSSRLDSDKLKNSRRWDFVTIIDMAMISVSYGVRHLYHYFITVVAGVCVNTYSCVLCVY